MRISFNWLKEFVDVPGDARTLGNKVTLVGLAVDSLQEAGGDTVLELDVTTNRPDCLNHLGVAREVSAIHGIPLNLPVFAVKESQRRADEVFSISIADDDLCGRYCGRYIEGVKVGPSPQWLKDRLELMGVRPINNVADITNYVIWELGHPLHAFDADALHGRQIIVRRADLDESLTTLDGVQRRLNPSILVIADADRAIALAGIMGGAETEISSTTANVLLESAYFNPLAIRKAARGLNMNTEASYRFERGADIEMARYACDRAAAMIQTLAGGEIYNGVIDVYPQQPEPVMTDLRRDRIESFLGAAVDDAIVERIFTRLEFGPRRTDTGWQVRVPTFRVDVRTEEDLLEEIARHHGFDKFPSTLPAWSGYGAALSHETEERSVRNTLWATGYSEICTYSFSDEESERRFRPEVEPVKLRNPMTEDGTVLRTSLVPGILKSIQWNLNRGIRDIQFYELSKVYDAQGERRSLILASTGAVRDFYDVKGDVEALLDNSSIPLEVRSADLPGYYHPGRAGWFGKAAVFGELHPEQAANLKIRQRVYLAELDVEQLFESKLRRPIKPVPRFPSIRRDFSLLLGKGTQYGEVRKTIASNGIAELVSVEPFDRLESGSFPETKYSLSISVLYRSMERTLTDIEIEKFDSIIIESLAKRLGAELRK